MLKFKLETIDELDESQRGLYKEIDGSFVLQVEGVKDKSEFETVYSTLQKERTDRKKLEKDLKKFEGINLEEINNQDEASKRLGLRVTELENSLLEKDTEINGFKTKITQNTINQQLDTINENRLSSGKLSLLKTQAINELKNTDGTFLSDKGETAKEWFERRGKEYDLFTTSGSGINNSGDKSARKKNPFVDGTLAERSALYKEDPTLYKKLQQEAK